MRARILLIALLLLFLAPPGFPQQRPHDEFAIYVAEPSPSQANGDLRTLILAREPVISAPDILSYDWKTHTMIVTTNAILRLPRFRTETFSNFVVVARGERCYAGYFWPLDRSARVLPPNVPIVPVPSDRSGALTPTALSIGINIRLLSQGFVSNPAAGGDVRSDPRVREMLSRLGKFNGIPFLDSDGNQPARRTEASRPASADDSRH